MGHRFPYRPTIAFFTALSVVLLGLGVAAAQAPATTHVESSGASNSLTVTVGSAFEFTLSTDQVTPGANVTISIVQTDDVSHTFTLSSVAGWAFNDGNTTSDLLAFFGHHAPLVNFSIPAGQATYTAYFTAPPFGIYEYVCLVAGHFQAGMRGFLGSGEAGSSAAPNTGPGAPVFIIGGTIAALVVLAIVLGFVIGRRRGASEEMPPERLGYPEPPSGPQPPATGGHS
jgi:plastocyanin